MFKGVEPLKFTKILCIVLVTIPLWLSANKASGKDEPAPANFSGVVVDISEVPIPYAHVWIHEYTNKVSFTIQPDKSGHFTINLPEGYYDVLVGAPGFAPFCKSIWIGPDVPIKLKVRLGPDSENLQD
jgi:hypothetical protein